jgi:hypothetical protein
MIKDTYCPIAAAAKSSAAQMEHPNSPSYLFIWSV